MIARMKAVSRWLMAALVLMCLCAGMQAQAQTIHGKAKAPSKVSLAPPPPDEDPPYNNASFSSQSVPATMTAGGVYTVTVAMYNNGTTTWTPAASYRLGSQNPQDNGTWGGGRAGLAGNVAPGQTGIFSFQVTAPQTPGTHNFQWKMVQEGVEWFGALSPNVAVTVSAPAPQNGAQAIGMSVPALTQGQVATISVTLKNTGTSTWSAGGNYMLGSQNPGENMTWGVQRVALASDVPPGQQYTFTFPITAPAAGTYTMQWQMMQRWVEWFGGVVSSSVTVGAPGDIVTYIHTDGLGSPVARTDSAGNLLGQGGRTSYEPYGRIATGATPTIGFTGHMQDADTGLVYMQQRYYDPVAGRFFSVDPVITDANTGVSFNRYVYVANNPYRYIDPDGRAIESISMDRNFNVHIVIGLKYDKSISPKEAAQMNARIREDWSGKKGKYAVNITILSNSKLVNHIFATNANRSETHGTRVVTLGRNGEGKHSMADLMSHEAAHLLSGGFDRYTSGGHPFEGWEGNIRGETGGKVEERNITEILEYHGLIGKDGEPKNAQPGNLGPQGCMAPGGDYWH